MGGPHRALGCSLVGRVWVLRMLTIMLRCWCPGQDGSRLEPSCWEVRWSSWARPALQLWVRSPRNMEDAAFTSLMQGGRGGGVEGHPGGQDPRGGSTSSSS